MDAQLTCTLEPWQQLEKAEKAVMRKGSPSIRKQCSAGALPSCDPNELHKAKCFLELVREGWSPRSHTLLPFTAWEGGAGLGQQRPRLSTRLSTRLRWPKERRAGVCCPLSARMMLASRLLGLAR